MKRCTYSDENLRIIQSAIEFISQNYSDITALDVAKHCNWSYSYFSRTFKKIMRMSFSQYLNQYRLNKAEQLLCTTDKTIFQISSEVGFSTSSYFIQLFKEKKKISPKKYREKFSALPWFLAFGGYAKLTEANLPKGSEDSGATLIAPQAAIKESKLYNTDSTA